MAAGTIVSADPSLRYTSMLLGTLSNQQTTTPAYLDEIATLRKFNETSDEAEFVFRGQGKFLSSVPS